MRTHKIEVLKPMIQSARQHDSTRCMIANAVQAAIPDAKYILVDAQSIRFSDVRSGDRFIYFTPAHAQRELLRFDEGLPVKPFSLVLREGYVRRMRVRAPGYVPSKKKYARKASRFMPTRMRVAGLRAVAADDRA